MAKAYSDKEMGQMLNPSSKDRWVLVDELKSDAESMPLIAMVVFFTLGPAVGFTMSKK